MQVTYGRLTVNKRTMLWVYMPVECRTLWEEGPSEQCAKNWLLQVAALSINPYMMQLTGNSLLLISIPINDAWTATMDECFKHRLSLKAWTATVDECFKHRLSLKVA